MRHITVAAVVGLLLFGALPALAQEDDEYSRSPFSFQGRVGALLVSEETFQNGASFEIGMMVRLMSGIHLSVGGGTANFNGGTEPIPITEEFALFWEDFLTLYEVVDPQEPRYRINFGTAGLALKFGGGAFEPYVIGGVGIYQVRFTYTFDYAPIGFPVLYDITSLQDQKYLSGWHAGGGVNVAINQIIGFAGQVSYHALNTEAIDNPIMVTFGLNVTIP